MPTGLGDFIKTGTLYKKRGGFFRNVPQQNWVPRTFALTHSTSYERVRSLTPSRFIFLGSLKTLGGLMLYFLQCTHLR